jgi:hypothetical protein
VNSERRTVATLSKPRPTTRRLAKNTGARRANDDGLGMREDSGNAEASYKNWVMYERWEELGPKGREIQRTWAFDIHEVRVGRLHETLQLMPLGLGLGRGVEEIDGERLFFSEILEVWVWSSWMI